MLPACLSLSSLSTATTTNRDGGLAVGALRNDALLPGRRRRFPRRRRHCSMSVSSSSPTTTVLCMSSSPYSPPAFPEESDRHRPSYEVALSDPPTSTQTEAIPLSVPPSRPKIVVLGASGRIGRRVVSRLLNSPLDLNVVAFVRNAVKFEDVMFDEWGDVGGAHAVVSPSSSSVTYGGNVRSYGSDAPRQQRGPNLEVVLGDLVSPADVLQNSESAGRSDAFGDVEDFDDDDDDDDVAEEADWNDEALRGAVEGATVIVSCAGTVRVSDLWTDYLKVPFLRIFRRDASKWCPDPSHPYYVDYLATRRVLELAEREQESRNVWVDSEKDRQIVEGREQEEEVQRRAAARATGADDDEDEALIRKVDDMTRKRRSEFGRVDDGGGSGTNKGGPSPTDRIKIVLISDLEVGRSPFRYTTVLSNVFRSMVFRYQYMGENLLEQSELVDTVVLRPGDLTDEERNKNNTSLQLSIDGVVPAPSLVGRDDVAALAVTAALTRTSANELNLKSNDGDGDGESAVGDTLMVALEGKTDIPLHRGGRAHHYTWAMRWTGQHVKQGLRPDGLRTAALCVASAMKAEAARERSRRRGERKLRLYHGGRELLGLRAWFRQRRKTRPYALAVALAVYITVGWMSWIALGEPVIDLVKKMKQANLSRIVADLRRLV